jgi:hypothetical protein
MLWKEDSERGTVLGSAEGLNSNNTIQYYGIGTGERCQGRARAKTSRTTPSQNLSS